MPEQHAVSACVGEPEVPEYVIVVDEDGVCIDDHPAMGLCGLRLNTAGGEAWLGAGLAAALGPALHSFLNRREDVAASRRLLVNDAPGQGNVTPYACEMSVARSEDRMDTTLRLRPIGVVPRAPAGTDFGRVLQESSSVRAAIVRLPDWHCLRATPGLADLLGENESGIQGGGLVRQFARPGDAIRLTESVARGETVENLGISLLSADGESVPVLVSGQRIDFRGTPSLLLLFTHAPDQHRLAELSAYDPLTALPNRNQFLERLDGALTAAERQNELAGLLFVDLDDFKEINDTYGHLVGDRLLTVTAQRLASAVRGYDMVARFGGDEFVVVLEHLGRPTQAETVARNLLDTIRKPLRIEGVALQVNASIGVAVYPDDAAAVGALLEAADSAMYRAKRRGASVVAASGCQARPVAALGNGPIPGGELVDGLIPHR